MRLTLNFPSKHEERIRKALNGEGDISKQMVRIIMTAVGQAEVNKFRADLDMVNQKKIQEQAQAVSKQLGLEK